MKTNTNHRWTLFFGGLCGLILLVPTANAIPAFARKYQTICSTCHTAYPKLNVTGRNFKENGYSFGDGRQGEVSVSDYLHWDKNFPLSGAVVSRPYDKQTGGNAKMRALHEVELFTAGKLYKNISTFFELESEDEDTNTAGNPFPTHVAAGMLTLRYSPELNAQLGYGQLLFADPYASYTEGRRLTAGRNSVVTAGNLVGDLIRHGHQQISVYGRIANQFFYNAGVAGLDSDGLGQKSRQYFARVAYDITPEIMVGAMGLGGTCYSTGNIACPANQDFYKYAVDTQIDMANFNLNGVYLRAEDDQVIGGTATNDSWYLQGVYTMRQDGRPTFVPLLRLDSQESNNGKDTTRAVTLNLAYYFTENVKGFVEYHNEFDTPTGVRATDRLLIQLEAAF